MLERMERRTINFVLSFCEEIEMRSDVDYRDRCKEMFGNFIVTHKSFSLHVYLSIYTVEFYCWKLKCLYWSTMLQAQAKSSEVSPSFFSPSSRVAPVKTTPSSTAAGERDFVSLSAIVDLYGLN